MSSKKLNPALRSLLGEEIWQMMQKGEDKNLKDMRYVVLCETCKQTFFETTAAAARDMFLQVKGSPFVPFMWYIHAARHFVAWQFHSIRIFVGDGHDRTCVKDLSSVWKSQMPKGTDFTIAMNAELDLLELQAAKAYGR